LAFQSSGNYFLGSGGINPFNASGLEGTYYRFVAYSAQLTASQIKATSGAIRASITARGVAVVADPVLNLGPQILAAGDSITIGQGVTSAQAWPANLTLVNQPTYSILNYGISGVTLASITGSEANRLVPLCQGTLGPSNYVIFAGTNDALNLATPQTLGSYMGSVVAAVKKAGCRVFVGTMLSRTGNASIGGTLDAFKDTYDAILLTNAKAYGADGIIDFAADPLLGADGANSNTTYFQGDGTHPTVAGQLRLSNAASNTLNYFYGYTLAAPHVLTASQTLASGDKAVLIGAAAANVALLMPDCTGPSGESYTISNPQALRTVSIQGGVAAQPINGLTTAITIAANATVILRDVANPKTTSGCQWAL
jgi:lysophospholipase L1-like esterase